MNRAELQQYLNSAFEIYSPGNGFIDRINGPGDIGHWLASPESPEGVAIFPVDYASFNREGLENRYFKVVRVFLDEQGEEIPGRRHEIIMVAFDPGDEKEAKKLARQYHCDHMYWSARDEDRYLFMIDLDMDVSIVYYFEYLD